MLKKVPPCFSPSMSSNNSFLYVMTVQRSFSPSFFFTPRNEPTCVRVYSQHTHTHHLTIQPVYLGSLSPLLLSVANSFGSRKIKISGFGVPGETWPDARPPFPIRPIGTTMESWRLCEEQNCCVSGLCCLIAHIFKIVFIAGAS